MLRLMGLCDAVLDAVFHNGLQRQRRQTKLRKVRPVFHAQLVQIQRGLHGEIGFRVLQLLVKGHRLLRRDGGKIGVEIVVEVLDELHGKLRIGATEDMDRRQRIVNEMRLDLIHQGLQLRIPQILLFFQQQLLAADRLPQEPEAADEQIENDPYQEYGRCGYGAGAEINEQIRAHGKKGRQEPGQLLPAGLFPEQRDQMQNRHPDAVPYQHIMQLHLVQRLQQQQQQYRGDGKAAAHLPDPSVPFPAQHRQKPKRERQHQQITDRSDIPDGLLPSVKIQHQRDGGQPAELPQSRRQRDRAQNKGALPVRLLQPERERKQHQEQSRGHRRKAQYKQRGLLRHQQHGEQRLPIDQQEHGLDVPDAAVNRRQRDRHGFFRICRRDGERQPVVSGGTPDVRERVIHADVGMDHAVQRQHRAGVAQIDKEAPPAPLAVLRRLCQVKGVLPADASVIGDHLLRHGVGAEEHEGIDGRRETFHAG